MAETATETRPIDGVTAARQVGRPYTTVVRWLREGRVPARFIGRTYLIDPEGMQALRQLAQSRERRHR